MTWVPSDDVHVAKQQAVYARRREKLLAVSDITGLVNDPLFVAGLYIWTVAKRSVGGVAGSSYDGGSVVGAPTGWDIVQTCAELGIVVVPGNFYGEAGCNRV